MAGCEDKGVGRFQAARLVAPEIVHSQELSPSLTRVIHLYTRKRPQVSVETSRGAVDELCSLTLVTNFICSGSNGYRGGATARVKEGIFRRQRTA